MFVRSVSFLLVRLMLANLCSIHPKSRDDYATIQMRCIDGVNIMHTFTLKVIRKTPLEYWCLCGKNFLSKEITIMIDRIRKTIQLTLQPIEKCIQYTYVYIHMWRNNANDFALNSSPYLTIIILQCGQAMSPDSKFNRIDFNWRNSNTAMLRNCMVLFLRH